MAEAGGSGKEQGGKNSDSFHSATHKTARALQQHTGLGKVLVEARRSSRSRQEAKNAPGWKTKHILGPPGMKLLRGSTRTPEGLCRTALLPHPEPSLSSAKGRCMGNGWQNLQSKAGLSLCQEQ